jgi:hypothetical protein
VDERALPADEVVVILCDLEVIDSHTAFAPPDALDTRPLAGEQLDQFAGV